MRDALASSAVQSAFGFPPTQAVLSVALVRDTPPILGAVTANIVGGGADAGFPPGVPAGGEGYAGYIWGLGPPGPGAPGGGGDAKPEELIFRIKRRPFN